MKSELTDAGGDAGLDVFSGRRSALLGSDDLQSIDSFLIVDPVHHRYLCGFSGSSAYLLLTHSESYFFTDGRYAEQSEVEVSGAEISIVEGPLRNALKGFVGPGQRIGFEAGRMTVSEAEALRTAFPQVEWRPVENVVEQLRLIKDEHEIASIQAASNIAVAVMMEVAGNLEQGVTELEITGLVEESLRRHGSEGSAFEPVVVSGVRGAMPHGRATSKTVQVGESVTIDFGAVSNGYHSDLTRTFVLGGDKQKFEEWQAVLDSAIEAALTLIQPGLPCNELDAAARGVIDEAGFGQYFIHNLGHGIGLEVHEGPHISRSSLDSLAEGMTFTIEPGIYIRGHGGIRIEENIVVTGDGPRLLTHASRTIEPPEN